MSTDVTGLHKHFRMISIHNDMTSHGFASEKAPHTRIPGIWKKLDQLYDLETLDARENEFAFSEDPDPADPQDAEAIPAFKLPVDEFGELMWQSRLHDPESEASSPGIAPVEEQKAIPLPDLDWLNDFPDGVRSQQAESVAESTPPKKKGTRASRSAVKSGKGTKAGNAARTTKAQSTVSDSEEEENEDDGEDESSSESEEEEEDSAPTTRRTNRAKAKPAPRRTRKR